jgi:hypothetical protein
MSNYRYTADPNIILRLPASRIVLGEADLDALADEIKTGWPPTTLTEA